MKQLNILVTFSTVLFFNTLVSQNLKIRQSSWQQRVDHKIQADFDATEKILRCFETITYTNNSPDVLVEIPMHIWPNAFSSLKTAYGKEALVNGNEKFLQAKSKDRGYLDSLSFEIEGQKTTFTYIAADIILVKLPSPLASGASIHISTPFKVKLPAMFSRMGYVKNLVAVTQWYPKPAVYDVNGWNYFSYLEQGEYYSEFGSYDVEITVPQNYVIGATGELQDEAELEWISELSDGTADKRNSKKKKTLHYLQDNIPDFAWFTDDEFKVGEAKVKLPNGEEVITYAFIHDDSHYSTKSVLEAIETALTYYSQRVGNYPYKYCSAVIGGLEAAGGMEYPMITICADGSAGTIIHEVGHNWFQGMLGNQERQYPWMDESINTFYQVYGEGNPPVEWSNGDPFPNGSGLASFHGCRGLGTFQAGNLHSEAYIGSNYGAIIYSANPLRFSYLQEYLGKAVFDSCMHHYFDIWHYRHPLPGDFQEAFEKTSGKNLNWFFSGLLGNSVPDLAIKSVHKTDNAVVVKISNKGDYKVPVKLEWKDGLKKEHVWLSGSDTTINVPFADRISLNPSGFLTEGNMVNNDAKTKGLFKTANKISLGFFRSNKRGENRISLFPLLGYNLYDGGLAGLSFTNANFPRRNWEWWLMPTYGFRSGQLVGIAGIQRNIWFNKGPFTLAEIRAGARTYSFMPDSVVKSISYEHVLFQAKAFLKRKKAWVQNSILADLVVNRVGTRFGVRDLTEKSHWNQDRENNLFRVGWIRQSYRKAAPFLFQAYVEGGNSLKYTTFLNDRNRYKFLKYLLDAKYFMPYHFFRSKTAGLRLRAFATGYLWYNQHGAARSLYDPVVSGASGNFDYAFRDLLLGRSESFGSGNLLGNQLLTNGTGVRMLPAITRNSQVAGVNLETSFIPKVPLKLFMDICYGRDYSRGDVYWAGGINFNIVNASNTLFEINLPLVYSANFDAAMSGLKWYEGINFKLNIFFQEPLDFVRNIY